MHVVPVPPQPGRSICGILTFASLYDVELRSHINSLLSAMPMQVFESAPKQSQRVCHPARPTPSVGGEELLSLAVELVG